MKTARFTVLLSLFLTGVFAILAAVPAESEAAGRKVTIAVVRDGPSEMNEIVDRIRPELAHLIGADHDVTFDMSDQYDAGWDPQNVRAVVEAAMNDRSVDIVMGIGWLVTLEAARPDYRLSKPFVSATLVDGDVPGVEFNEDGKLKPNLSLTLQPQRTDTEVELIRRLINPKRVHLVMSREIFDNVPGVESMFDRYGGEIGVEIVPVLVSTEWEPVMETLDPDVEMVFFQHTPRLTLAQRAAFVEALNARKIPTFSGDGPEDIEIGMLATNRTSTDQPLSRRVALNLFQLISGSSTADLPVLLLSEAKLVINGKTAAEIGFGLTFEARVLGTLLHPEALEARADSLTLRAVLARADSGNVALSISNQEVQTAERYRQIDRSPLLPQLGVGADYINVDNPLVGNIFPQRWARANVNLSQMIFDDEFISNFRSTGREYEAAMAQNESNRMDVYLDAGGAYLEYVQTRLFYEIALENLRLTEGNLDIAKMRVEVGHSGRDEVYRWTAELNKQRTGVMDIESLMETQRIELNRLLGEPLSKRWRPERLNEDSNSYELLREKLGFALESQANFDKFTDVAVDIALESSPERMFLVKNIEAEGIQLGYNKRSFIVPKVFFNLGVNHNFWQSPDEPELGETFYDMRIVAELPIFQGTKRVYDMKLSQSLIVELERRLMLADQYVEQRTRSSLRQLQASLPNIGYSRIAAENARKNFEVVRDQYTNGIVNITDLISAQAASFTSEQDALVSFYTFMLDSIEFQRSVAFFTDTRSRTEIDQFVEEIRQRIQASETP